MWNQTTEAAQATAAAATSDNSKEVASAEECGCAANSFDNSKHPKSSFGGKINEKTEQRGDNDDDNAINKQKEFAAQSETSDSGFISGPQSSQIFSEEIISEHDTATDTESKPKTAPAFESSQKTSQAPDQKQIASVVLDSGIIDEVETEEEDNDEQEQQNPTSSQAGIKQQPAATEQMRLKHNTDAGIPQWTVQSNLAGRGEVLNNLGTSTSISGRSKAISSDNKPTNAAASASASGSANLNNSSINIINAWEQFYQQNDDGDTPLHLACISGYVDVVAALIRMAPHPCLLNIQNDVAQTPLHLAALTAQPNIMRMLLLAGAEPTVRDRHGNTALHLSCIAGEKQCVRALTEKFGATEIHEAHRQYGHRSNDKAVSSLSYARLPADLEIRNYDGERCVHLAAEAGHIDILRILVSHGADINAREGKSGRTPLHIAIEGCNEDLANFLLDECEKLNLETATFSGLTAYQFACIMNKSRMQNILEKRGAETVTPPDSDYDSSDIEDLDDTKMYDRFGDPRYFVSYNGGNPMTVA
ncbi:NF-kappa-B inhibitor cactus [Drosophila miranda]|uniref:NF-kappa-B inhibitor cactus n=1 Tax=Drosophila miranda TaxID=7229 RepID=UPI0007E5C929|nr:NF-kappa-B inhibitor cactus [Drosophila miranda]